MVYDWYASISAEWASAAILVTLLGAIILGVCIALLSSVTGGKDD